MSADGEDLIKKYSSPDHGTVLHCTVILIKTMELFLLKIPRRQRDLSPVTLYWTYLMSAWGKLSNVITSQVPHPIRRDTAPRTDHSKD